MLAPSVQKYFWDIDIASAKPKAHPKYYIERILELGDTRAFEWLKRVYGLEKIKKILPQAKLSSRSKKYWDFYFFK